MGHKKTNMYIVVRSVVYQFYLEFHSYRTSATMVDKTCIY